MFSKIKTFIPTILSGCFIILGFLVQKSAPSFAPFIFIAAFIIGGYEPARKGIQDTIENKELNVELLMILAAIGACLIDYWEEGAILIFIFALSGALEDYATDKNKREIEKLMDFQPEIAHLINADGSMHDVSADSLKPNDTIYVLKGEALPIDGIICEGTSSFSEAAITGEALPKEKTIGDDVFGATINETNPIKITVTKEPHETLVRKIVKMVEDSQSAPSKSAQFIHKIENKYVWTVLIVVVFMLFLPHFLFAWSWNETFYRAMVLLVVASPCALVASISPATLSAISNAAKNGVLVKGGVHLENLHDIKAIAFDKTGTLTYGFPEITEQFFLSDFDIPDTFQAVSAIESSSTHPLSAAIIKSLQTSIEASNNKIAENIEDVAGFGIQGTYNEAIWKIGKKDFMPNIDEAHEVFEKADIAAKNGKTIVFVSKNEQVIGFFALEDILRPEAIDLIQFLNTRGIATIMITGDNEHTANVIASQLEISRVVANCLPDEKAQIIQNLRDEFSSIAMVGDGINDAPALSYATVGIAMGQGTDIAIEAADVILMQNDIGKIKYALGLSNALRKITTFNVVFSLTVICILILANFTQNISLPLGVIGHEGSTILVILNGLRLLNYKE